MRPFEPECFNDGAGTQAWDTTRMKIIEQLHNALNRGITADIFNNLRNLVTCTMVLAAALAASRNHQAVTRFGDFSGSLGSFIAFVAIVLAVLNLYDGAYRISRRGKNSAVVVVFVAVYAALSFRIGQLVSELQFPGH
ncbi:MAG: hypothetical protein KDI37_13630 [Xanthomonadales bacterium]|nr:hypothetical protein [Xanthomonadales bacterium]